MQPGQTPAGRSRLSPRRSPAGVLRPRCESARKNYRHNHGGGLERFQATSPGRDIPVFRTMRGFLQWELIHIWEHTYAACQSTMGRSTGSVPEPSSILLLGSGVLVFAAVMRRRLKMWFYCQIAMSAGAASFGVSIFGEHG